ncbi:MAG TPA: alpha/beta hydrolase [Burkholderiales bacterium]|nr:alpha/beta hydrolase [Burkholderiales bacterium]
MELLLEKKKVYAYTAAHELDAAKPTVAFLHGAGLEHSSFALQSRYFGYHGWNVLALDFPGHGRSEGPPIPTVQGMADWVIQVLNNLKVEKATLVGHSMGSLVAVEAAARHPQRVERIALVATAYPMKVTEAFLDAARRNDLAAIDMHTIWGHGLHVPLSGNPSPGMWMHGDNQARVRRLAPGVLYNDLKAVHEYVFSGEASCPALFILGRRDVMTPPRNAQALQEKLKNSRTVLVSGSGHALMAEAPDETLDALIAFLSATSAPAPQPTR